MYAFALAFQRLVAMFTVQPDARGNKMARMLNGSKTTRIIRNDAVMNVCITQTAIPSGSEEKKVSPHAKPGKQPSPSMARATVCDFASSLLGV